MVGCWSNGAKEMPVLCVGLRSLGACLWWLVGSWLAHPMVLPYRIAADTVICMDAYVPSDATAAARAISARHAGTGDRLPRHETYGDITPRTLASGEGLGQEGEWGREWEREGEGEGEGEWERGVEREHGLSSMAAGVNMCVMQPLAAFLPAFLRACWTSHPQAHSTHTCCCCCCCSVAPAAVHPRPVSAHGRDLRVKTRTLHCIQLDQEEELDLRCAGGLCGGAGSSGCWCICQSGASLAAAAQQRGLQRR